MSPLQYSLEWKLHQVNGVETASRARLKKIQLKKIKCLLMGNASAPLAGDFPGRRLAEGGDLALWAIAGVK